MNDIAVMHAVVRDEIRQQEARVRARVELNRTMRADRERMLAKRIAELDQKYTCKPNLFKRLWTPVENAWCMGWAIWLNAPEIFLNWCVAMGWIERVEKV